MVFRLDGYSCSVMALKQKIYVFDTISFVQVLMVRAIGEFVGGEQQKYTSDITGTWISCQDKQSCFIFHRELALKRTDPDVYVKGV